MNQLPYPLACLLTDDETHNALCLKYWSVDATDAWTFKVDDIAGEGNLNSWEFLSRLRSTCSAFLPGVRCLDCAAPARMTSRSDYASVKRAIARSRQYRCSACESALQKTNRARAQIEGQARQERVKLFLHELCSRAAPVDFGSLSFTDAFLLYSVLTAAGEQWNDQQIAPLAAQCCALAPTPEMSAAIYDHLYRLKIIFPSASSQPDAMIHFDEDGGELTFDPSYVAWTLAPDLNGWQPSTLLLQLEEIIELPDEQSLADLWYLVAEKECERYFGELCERYRFNSTALYTEKVSLAIRYALERLSLPQVWNILWCVMRNIAALIQEGTYLRPHIYNMVSGNIRRDVDRRIANKQHVRPWTRLPQSKEPVVTSLLFDKVLKTGTRAFEEVNGQNVRSYAANMFDSPVRGAFGCLPSQSDIEPARQSADLRGHERMLSFTLDGTLIDEATLRRQGAASDHNIDEARDNDDLFFVHVDGKRWYPGALLRLARATFAAINRALGATDPTSKLLFLLHRHGALEGMTAEEAVVAGRCDDVLRLAEGWART